MCYVYHEGHLLENIFIEETCRVEKKNFFKKAKQISGFHKTAEFLEQLRQSHVFNTQLSELTYLSPSPVSVQALSQSKPCLSPSPVSVQTLSQSKPYLSPSPISVQALSQSKPYVAVTPYQPCNNEVRELQKITHVR
jgi:hypothetical protein